MFLLGDYLVSWDFWRKKSNFYFTTNCRWRSYLGNFQVKIYRLCQFPHNALHLREVSRTKFFYLYPNVQVNLTSVIIILTSLFFFLYLHLCSCAKSYNFLVEESITCTPKYIWWITLVYCFTTSKYGTRAQSFCY